MKQLALLVLLLANATCSLTPLGDGHRRVVVRELTEDVIVPTLTELETKVAALQVALEALAATPTPGTLEVARTAWRAARVPWKHADAFAFGPAADQQFGVELDQFPVDPPKIESEIAGTATLTAAYVGSIGANRKGFHAVEYVLFSADALSQIQGAPRRAQFLVALVGAMAVTAADLHLAWGGSYAETLAAPGTTNATYQTIKASVDVLVNESLFLAETVADARLGKPLGLATGGTPQPQLAESGYSDNSLADMTSELESIGLVYGGSTELELDEISARGVGAIVQGIQPRVDRDVRLALQVALAAVAAVPRPFAAACVEHPEAVTAAYDAVKALKTVLATEVVAALGSTLKFNDNDGD